MLFNSAVFLFAFLPLALVGFLLLARAGSLAAAAWLVLASIAFYGWRDAAFVPLLVGSIVFNYAVGTHLASCVSRGAPVRAALALGIGVDLAMLGYFKYANFFLQSTVAALGADVPALDVLLPVGISFFTFTQIAYLVDAARGETRAYGPVQYALFVSYFPHLVAGPILHHREMMPQFAQLAALRSRWEDWAGGVTILGIGLFKKVGLADHLAPAADAVFAAAAAGRPLAFVEAWAGALAYTFQLYFDFSGYSDMAIGISLLFGIRLPVNFDSPYKATNIADFWRRWHMTLSRFLRDYLYVPLGGNRRGPARRYVNLFATMVLGGLWHGAGWTFIAWGALHGAGLALHRAFSGTTAARWLATTGWAGRRASALFTFAFVVVAWVFFRADSMHGALTMLGSMSGLDTGPRTTGLGLRHGLALIALAIAAWTLPNTQQIMARVVPALSVYRPITPARRPALWMPSAAWLAFAGVCAWIGLYGVFTARESPYLYFNF